MELGYYKKPLKHHEKIILIVLCVLVIISVTWVNLSEYPSIPVFFMVLPILSFLTVGFLIPPLFYKLQVDMGKLYNILLWSIPMTLLAFGYTNQSNNPILFSITKVPMLLFIYLHIMRLLYFLETKQQPAFGATWYRKGSKDKIADRRISSDDILFNMIYTAIPIVSLLIYLWYKEVYK